MSAHGLPIWLTLSYMLPDFIAQPFSIFGTLAIAESQAEETVTIEKTESGRTRSKSRTRPRKMVTSDLSSVLSLYHHLPNAKSRIFRASLTNMLADRLVSWPCAWLASKLASSSTRQRRPIVVLLLSALFELLITTATAPLRLLATELIVFRHFDWRFVQLNSKLFPIFLPNLASALISFLLFQLSDIMLDRFSDLITIMADGPTIPIYKIGMTFSLIVTSTLMLFGCQALAEIWRVKADLLVLNGENTIVPVDETYEGEFSDLIHPQYSLLDALKRYTRVCGVPVAFSYLLAGFSTPLISQLLYGSMIDIRVDL